MGSIRRVRQEAAPAPAPGAPRVHAAASAPAKCIVLGEHAVVYGEPCLSIALDRRTEVAAQQTGDRFRVNGYPMNRRHHTFIESAVKQAWGADPALRFRVRSRIPSAGGIGSSAALSVATVAACERLAGRWEPSRIARLAFAAEREAQGAGSPNDTSVSTAGGTVFLSPQPSGAAGLTRLWTMKHGDRAWVVQRAPPARFDVPATWVIGHTGVKASTRDQVEHVRRLVERPGLGRETIEAIGALTWQGLDAFRAGDAAALGALMDAAHERLVTLGVGHPLLDALVSAARAARGTLGAKLTGAGGGGAMVVLTTSPRAAAAAIRAAGGRAFPLRAASDGVRQEPGLEVQEASEDGPVEPAGAAGALRGDAA